MIVPLIHLNQMKKDFWKRLDNFEFVAMFRKRNSECNLKPTKGKVYGKKVGH